MAKRKPRPPRYCLHKASGQARVTIAGRDHYLGPYDSEASHRAYRRLIARHFANGQAGPELNAADGATVAELAAGFLAYAAAQLQPRRSGRLQVTRAVRCLDVVTSLYATLPASAAHARAVEYLKSRGLKVAG